MLVGEASGKDGMKALERFSMRRGTNNSVAARAVGR